MILASKSKRLANFLIDNIFVSLITAIVCSISKIVEEEKLAIVFIFFEIVYYVFFEFFFHKTIGKIITKTKVVGRNENSPSILEIILRTVLRLSPFDFLSYFSSLSDQGTHDILSKIYVVYIGGKAH